MSRTQPVYSNAGFVQPLEIRKGSDFLITFLLLNGTPENPVDVTGLEVRAMLKHLASNTLTPFVVGTPEVRADGNAYVTLTLPRATTAGLPLSSTSLMAPPIFRWTCDVKLAAGNVVPICYGPAKTIEGDTQWP